MLDILSHNNDDLSVASPSENIITVRKKYKTFFKIPAHHPCRRSIGTKQLTLVAVKPNGIVEGVTTF